MLQQSSQHRPEDSRRYGLELMTKLVKAIWYILRAGQLSECQTLTGTLVGLQAFVVVVCVLGGKD